MPDRRFGEKLLYTIEESSELLSLSRAQLYRLIDRGELSTVTIGASRRITVAQLEAYISGLEYQAGFTVFHHGRSHK